MVLTAIVVLAMTRPASALQTDGKYWQTLTPAEQQGVVSVAIDAIRDLRNNYVYMTLQDVATALDKQTGTKNHLDWNAIWKKIQATQPTFSRTEDYYAGEVTAYYQANPSHTDVYIADVVLCLQDDAQTASCEASLH